MGKIVCLMGKSSSGKDTIYKHLITQTEIQFKKIIPYTTRPLREGEKEGREYHFTNEEGYREFADSGKVIESRKYCTYYGIWRYFTVDDNQIDLDKEDYLVIGTLEAYLQFCEYYGKDKIVPVMISLDDGERLSRALNRERTQSEPKYEELCRRFLADAEDFSEEKLAAAGIEEQFDNDDLEKCLNRIMEYLKKKVYGH